MTKKPWYQKGLHFQCTGCGDCCTGAPGYVWVNQEEVEALAAAIGVHLKEFIANYTRQLPEGTSLVEFSNGDCVFFDNVARHCKVYDHRPRQCRTWPFWESNLESPGVWAQVARCCPGIGQGSLVSLEEITAQAKVVKV